MGEGQFGRGPFQKQCSKYYSILVRIKPMNRCLNIEGNKLISVFFFQLYFAPLSREACTKVMRALHDFIGVKNVNF